MLSIEIHQSLRYERLHLLKKAHLKMIYYNRTFISNVTKYTATHFTNLFSATAVSDYNNIIKQQRQRIEFNAWIKIQLISNIQRTKPCFYNEIILYILFTFLIYRKGGDARCISTEIIFIIHSNMRTNTTINFTT